MIKYKNGSKDVFSKETNFLAENYKHTQSNSQSRITMAERGKNDAKLYYHGASGCVVGTVLATLSGDIVLGLVPACACSSTPPADRTLNYPDEKLMRDPIYGKAYKDEAYRIKRKKTWNAFGYTAGAEVAVVVICVGILISTLGHSSFNYNGW